MSVRLMVEVLDHYHGPPHRKLWLLAWAEKANDQTRTGWPGREVLAHRTGKSASRVSTIATELIGEGVIKRVGGGGRHRGEARYEMLPLVTSDSQGSAGVHPENARQSSAKANPDTSSQGSDSGSQGSDSGSQGSPISPPPAETPHIPHNPQEPSSRARARGIIRAAFPDATDDETDKIIQDKTSHGARNLAAVLAHEAREGTLALPCDRDGPGRHSNACRSGDPRDCAAEWCACRCHTEPAGKETGKDD